MKRLRTRDYLIIGIAGMVGVVFFILTSHFLYRIGFPLDDAWIHQTYARNIALRGEFSFIPGQPSAGSTSPLWTILLVPGQFLEMPGAIYYGYFLGFGCLVLIGLFGELLFRTILAPESQLVEQKKRKIPVAGLVLMTEWHLVWAACSGMETGLYTAMILLVLMLSWKGKTPAFWLGVLVGLSIWVRPDGITLLGPVGLMLIVYGGDWKDRGRKISLLLLGLLIPLAGYLLFNISLSGSFWPSTFYAKQAEYASLWRTGILTRFIQLARLPLVGIGILLLPGFLFQAWMIVQKRKWKHAALLLWWLGYTAIYAYRLPVEYQHGRYLIPAMPVYFLLGLIGTEEAFSRLNINSRMRRLVGFAGKAAAVLIIAAFLVTGAQAYATDVAIIETEMVDTAIWLRDHTSPGDLLAVHDIGAVGYFSERQIVDLAGLVTPEVIPFIRDEGALADYLDDRNVAYLVVFPDWYPSLQASKEIVFQTRGRFSVAEGGMNMTVYRWNSENSR